MIEPITEEPEVALPLGHYVAVFRHVSGSLRQMAFPGNAWRGALGASLRGMVCVTGHPTCDDCPLASRCLYPWFFETPPPASAGKMRKYQNAPHPYVLRPRGRTAGNETHELGFTLVGESNDHLPLFAAALARAASGPRGVAGQRFELVEIRQETRPGNHEWTTIATGTERPAQLPPAAPLTPRAPGSATIQLATPVRVKRNGRIVGPDVFSVGDLFGNVLRRLSLLSTFHAGIDLERDFRGLNDLARTIAATGKLEWQERTRYSARQERKIRLQGVTGWLLVDDAGLARLWPYLWAGQWVHAGANATMGLGEYHLIDNRNQPSEKTSPCRTP